MKKLCLSIIVCTFLFNIQASYASSFPPRSSSANDGFLEEKYCPDSMILFINLANLDRLLSQDPNNELLRRQRQELLAQLITSRLCDRDFDRHQSTYYNSPWIFDVIHQNNITQKEKNKLMSTH
jgi:hypothetical protein